MRKGLVISLGALLVLALGVGLVFASDSAPTKEPETSPFFEATLQQAVDELDGKARPAVVNLPRSAGPQQGYYTDDEQIWPECAQGYTRDLVQWPWCHYTSDPEYLNCDTPWPTKDYTWDHNLWPECDPTGVGITQDPNSFWCNSTWTHDPTWGPQCEDPTYTRDIGAWPWCNPRYTQDPAQWPSACDPGVQYTYDPRWSECDAVEFTTDPFRWAECHYTSDPQKFPTCSEPYPTMDYTSNSSLWPECPGPEYTVDVQRWPWCSPEYTTNPQQWPQCSPTGNIYTQEPSYWPWCEDPLYTSNPREWPQCHYTSDPIKWEQCIPSYPTRDYTFDANFWPECDGYTYNGNFMCDVDYTQYPQTWPWCDPGWTWDTTTWSQCKPGYTNDLQQWPECRTSRQYTNDPIWPECQYHTADPGIWPECHYTSDPQVANCDGTWFPTKDYTTDTQLWPRDCAQNPQGDLGDAPDRTNHTPLMAGNMTAYLGVDAYYPVVFDPATGFPQGPKHWYPRADAWLGPTVTLEYDADLPPDQDTVTNIDPPSDTPDRDVGDDGVNFPVPAPHCEWAWFTYTVTIPPGTAGKDRYVNVWFDWTQDGDWLDTPYCPPPKGSNASEWAVQDQLIPGGLPPGTYVFATPPYLAWFPQPASPEEVWMRISIAEQKAPQVAGAAALADGRGPVGGYEYGETEDYFFKPDCPKPTADFSWDPPNICPTTIVQFWDNSTSQIPILTWAWDFGDSSGTSALQNPTYSYGATGTYDVSLTVRNACGSDTITKTLTVTDCTTQEDHDIYIKDNDADDGSVPTSSPWWSSPDIWVRNDVTDDCAVDTTHQNPIPGTQNKVCVRVRNRMATTVNDITVNVYYASAALGLTWPGDFSYIGNLFIASLAGGAQTTGSVLWNTPYSAGHFCLRARADAPLDPIGSGPDTIAPVDYVYNNNNIAQKNTNTVGDPSVTECGQITSNIYTDTVYFDAVNTKTSAVQADIEFDSDDFPLGTGTLIIDPGGLGGGCSSLTNLSAVGGKLIPTAFPATMGDCALAASETVLMTMTIAAPTDETFTLSVVELISDTEIGGIDYIRDLPHCYYLPLILKAYSP